jgi:tetratricopeptide (TPR) repeat protein
MTETETPQPDPESDSVVATASDAASEPEPEPPPEPWTPERVSEWNAYYDVYVKWAALLLVFLVSCNYVTDSNFWMHLKTGQLIAERSGPVMTDPFSYTEEGKPWVDVPWLFQWLHAAVYKAVLGLVPVDPTDTTANRAGAEQIAIGTLVAMDALARLLTAWLLLKIRHRGPGLWWSAVTVTMALGVMLHPFLLMMIGGLAGPGFVRSSTWGMLLLAFELLLLFRAFFQGKGNALWFLIPTFILWANLDESFLTGLLILAAAAVGRWLDGSRLTRPVRAGGKRSDGDASAEQEERNAAGFAPAGTGMAFFVLACSAAACFVNPFTYRTFAAALYPYLHYFDPAGSITTVDQLSFFSRILQKELGDDWYKVPLFSGLVVVAGGFSFWLNRRRFSWTRLLPFVVASVLWALYMHSNAAFALVFAAIVGPNGQEWYHDRVGTQGRLGRNWTAWSTGGRLVTLTVLFLTMSKDITGWGNTMPDAQFGLGYRPDDFTLEAAEYLGSHSEIGGNVLNTSVHQGDLLIWKAAPKRKTYVDGRPRLFPQSLLEKWHQTRTALMEDDIAAWKPLLDEYQVSAVMIEPVDARITYQRLMQSLNWIPFYDDGRVVMFGRADAPPADLAFFKANRLDADHLAYHKTRPVTSAPRPPIATSWVDGVFQNRTFSRPQSRTESALRWLQASGLEDLQASAEERPIPTPARCLLAIQEARTALARSPDDWIAFRRLKDAYHFLMVQEAAMLAGIPITPENQRRIRSVSPPLEHLIIRYQQRVAALFYAIQTTPPPRTAAERRDLAALNLQLFQLYYVGAARDLARDRLAAVVQQAEPNDFPAETLTQFHQQLEQLEQEVTGLKDRLTERAIDQQSGPIEQALAALSQGLTGEAIERLSEAERNSLSPPIVKPRLIDIYCSTGQPDRALELFSGVVDDPNLGAEPGAAAFRQGRVYFLLGDYLPAATLWQDKSIPRLRFDRSSRVLNSGAALSRGEAIPATDTFLSLPATLRQQASWTYELGLCQLEAGLPDDAAESLTKALTLGPDLPVRPIAAYYLERLGKPVPPPSKGDRGAATPAPAVAGGAAPATPVIPPPSATTPAPAAPVIPTPAATPAPAPGARPSAKKE